MQLQTNKNLLKAQTLNTKIITRRINLKCLRKNKKKLMN